MGSTRGVVIWLVTMVFELRWGTREATREAGVHFAILVIMCGVGSLEFVVGEWECTLHERQRHAGSAETDSGVVRWVSWDIVLSLEMECGLGTGVQ